MQRRRGRECDDTPDEQNTCVLTCVCPCVCPCVCVSVCVGFRVLFNRTVTVTPANSHLSHCACLEVEPDACASETRSCSALPQCHQFEISCTRSLNTRCLSARVASQPVPSPIISLLKFLTMTSTAQTSSVVVSSLLVPHRVETRLQHDQVLRLICCTRHASWYPVCSLPAARTLAELGSEVSS